MKRAVCILFLLFSGVPLMAQNTDQKASGIDLSGLWRIRLNNTEEMRLELKDKPSEAGAFCGTIKSTGKDGTESVSAVCVGVVDGSFNLLYGPAMEDGKPIPLVGCKTPYEGTESIKGSCNGFGQTLPFEASRISTPEKASPKQAPKQ